MIVEETKEPEEEQKKDPTKEEVEMNQKLLEADAKIVQLEKEKKALETAAKEKALNEILEKKGVKKEFQEFAKFKLQWQEVSDLDKATDDFINNNPALIEPIDTGGNGNKKIITDGEPEIKENRLLKIKAENS